MEVVLVVGAVEGSPLTNDGVASRLGQGDRARDTRDGEGAVGKEEGDAAVRHDWGVAAPSEVVQVRVRVGCAGV